MYILHTKGGSKVNRSGKSNASGFGSGGSNESPLMRRNAVRRRRPADGYDSENHRRLSSDEMETVMRKLTEFEAV